jgi:cytoskeletal protein RodZ
MKTQFSVIRMLNFFKKGNDMKILLTLVFVAAIATLGVMNGNVQGQGSEHPTEHPKSEHPKSEHPKSEHPKSEHPKSEHPKSEHPKSEHPKSEHPKSEHPKSEHPGAGHPK